MRYNMKYSYSIYQLEVLFPQVLYSCIVMHGLVTHEAVQKAVAMANATGKPSLCIHAAMWVRFSCLYDNTPYSML